MAGDDAQTQTFSLTFYESEINPVARVVTVPWLDIVEQLSIFNEVECTPENCKGQKCPYKSCEAWSPAQIAGGGRLDENVVAVHLSAFDADHITEKQLLEFIGRAYGYAYVIHSTHQHRPDNMRLRIVMPLSRPLTPSEYPRFRQAAEAHFAIPPDKKTSDLSRLYFLPTHPIGVEPLLDVGEGIAIDVDAMLAEAKGLPALVAAKKAKSHAGTSGAGTASDDVGSDGVSLKKLRECLVEYRRAKVASNSPEDYERYEIIGRVLKGEAIAAPGARGSTVNQAASILAFCLPIDTPVLAVAELLRPSIEASNPDVEGEDVLWYLERATDSFERSTVRRAEKDEQQRIQNAEIIARLSEVRRKKGMSALPASAGGSDGDDDDESGEPAADKLDKPNIPIDPADTCRMVKDAIQALSADTNLYQRAGELVTVVREPDKTEEYTKDVRNGLHITLRPGMPRIHTITLPSLYERLDDVAYWTKVKKKSDEIYCVGPCNITNGIVHSRKDWPGIPPLRTIIETPTFAPGGRLVTELGYDAEIASLLMSSIKMEPIPEKPTKEQAFEALKRIWIDTLCDIPFKGLDMSGTAEERYERARTSCPDAFVALAMLFTLLARPAIEGAVPGVVLEASTQGSGKSLQIKIISAIATGRPPGMGTLPPSDEEVEKVLASHALVGTSLIAFDNISSRLGGAPLEGRMTAYGTISFRVLGRTDQRSMPWYAAFAFSGNNMTMSRDVAQRVLVSRIVSPLEDPRSRPTSEFRHPDVIGWIGQHRAELLRDCFIVLRAFFVAEEKPDCGTMGSFEAWAAIIPQAIAYAGGPNVLDARPKRDGGTTDEYTEARSTIVNLWPFKEPARSAEVLHKVFDGENIMTKVTPAQVDLRAAVRVITRTREGQIPNAIKLGKNLGAMRDQIYGGKKLVCDVDRDDISWWLVVLV